MAKDKINYGGQDAQDRATSNLRKIKSVKWQPLYDSTVITTARAYEFFKVPVGNADVDGTLKTLSETNQTVSGQIPNASRFEIFGVRVGIHPNGISGSVTKLTTADYYNVLQDSRAYLQVFVRKDIALELPLKFFTSGYGLTVANRTADAGGDVTNGNPAQSNILNLLPNVITIPEMVPFSVKVSFDAIYTAIATNRIRMFVSLEGVFREPIYK